MYIYWARYVPQSFNKDASKTWKHSSNWIYQIGHYALLIAVSTEMTLNCYYIFINLNLNAKCDILVG